MAIFGVTGGIGTGKTLTGIYMLIRDLELGKKIFTNCRLKGLERADIKNVTYLTKEIINDMFTHIKEEKLNMRNSTVFIQEMHNYIDSRTAMSKKNRTLTYWILQSRHTGEGSSHIIYDTQELKQVDLRLRRNTDYHLKPLIYKWDIIKGKRVPKVIIIIGEGLIGHRRERFNFEIDVSKVRDMYDTHEIVDF